MGKASLLRGQLKEAHELLEGTMLDVTAEQGRWLPPGVANPLGATYAHAVLSEDGLINVLLKGGAPLAATSWAGRTGVAEPMPQFPAPWHEWGRRVKMDLPALRQYAQAVYTASDEYLASLSDEDLIRVVDLSIEAVGQQSLGWLLSNAVVGHVNQHCGEVACLKGLQGMKGYPF
jgi:hypothetical protein